MTRRSGAWRLAATLYVAINALGAVYAVAMGEVPHAAVHVVLLVVGAAVWSRYGPTRGADAPGWGDTHGMRSSADVSDRFRNLERSIDAVALEVERIGEGQRFMTNLLVGRESPPAAERGASEPADRDKDRSSS